MTDLPTVCGPTSETRPAHGNPWPGAASDSLWLTVETIGIVSASNEAGRQLPERENDRRDEALRRDLVGYGPSQVRGRFGKVDKPFLCMVNPFVVVNVAKKTVVALGAKYHQSHVIFGAREGEGEGLAMRFELVEADWGGRVLAARKIFFDAHRQRLYFGAACPGNRGRHFVIPGIDDTDLDLTPLSGQ